MDSDPDQSGNDPGRSTCTAAASGSRASISVIAYNLLWPFPAATGIPYSEPALDVVAGGPWRGGSAPPPTPDANMEQPGVYLDASSIPGTVVTALDNGPYINTLDSVGRPPYGNCNGTCLADISAFG